MLSTYSRQQITNSNNHYELTPNVFQSAFVEVGLNWNYFIAPYIDRDLHEKLLDVTQEEMAPIASVIIGILSLIRSGYFYTAKLQILQADVSYSSKLTEIKTWLVQVLTEADDTQE